MKTPYLLEIRPTGPSRWKKVKTFKQFHGFWTHHHREPHSSRRVEPRVEEEEPWLALAVRAAHQQIKNLTLAQKEDPVELIAQYERLLADTGLLVSGPTELEALRRLCAANNISCTI